MKNLLPLKDKIKLLLTKDFDLPPTLLDNSEDRIPSMGQSGVWKYEYLPKLLDALNNFLNNIDILDPQKHDFLHTKIDQIELIFNSTHSKLLAKDFEKFTHEFDLLIKNVESLLDFLHNDPFKFLFNDNNHYDFNHIVDLIQINYFKGHDSFLDICNKIFNENNNDLRVNALKKISYYSINHSLSDINHQFSLINELNSIYNNFIKDQINSEVSSLNEKKRFHEENIKKEYIKIELSKNSELISAFGDQSKDLQTSIQILYFAIFGVFLIILGSIFYKMNDTLNSSHDWDIRNLYFLSFILSLSALLTFLIKEKNSLMTKMNYFHKCHVELKALSSYVAGIDKHKVEQLKIDLAPIYFTAGETSSINNPSEPTLSNNQVTQILDILKEGIKK